MSKFSKGDRVRIKNDDPNRVSDLEADMLSSLEDRTLSGKSYDKIEAVIANGLPWIITSDGEKSFELKLEGTNIYGPWALEADDLEAFI